MHPGALLVRYQNSRLTLLTLREAEAFYDETGSVLLFSRSSLWTISSVALYHYFLSSWERVAPLHIFVD
jgi:hypothetical protein